MIRTLFQAPVQAPIAAIDLPVDPEFGIARKIASSVNHGQAVDGTVYTYVKIAQLSYEEVTFTFTNVPKEKLRLLLDFFHGYSAAWMSLTLYVDTATPEIWQVLLLNNPPVYTIDKKATDACDIASGGVEEVGSISLNFYGKKVGGP
jgi:hypothetical protein